MDDLFKALEMFKSGVQQYAISGAVNDANATMQQLNQANIDEGQKRQQQQQLANSLALQLTGANASGTQIQSAFNALNPQAFGSVEQMQLEGELQGNQYLTGTADKILGQREANKQRTLMQEFNNQLYLQKEQFKNNIALKQMDIAGKASVDKREKLKQGMFEIEDRRTNINAALDALEKQVADYGTFEALGSQNMDMERLVDQIATDMAKLQDPQSVARPSEVELVKRTLIQPTLFTRNKTASQIMKNFRGEVERRANGAYKIRGLELPNDATSNETSDVNLRVNQGWKRRQAPDGRIIEYRQLPDGQVQIKK